MSDIKPDTFQKPKPHPLIAFLPDYLKDPANYDAVQKVLIEAGATRHSHGEIGDWAKCKHCQQRQWRRKEMMFRLGFKNGGQYLAWKQIHLEIKKRVPLTDWGKNKSILI